MEVHLIKTRYGTDPEAYGYQYLPYKPCCTAMEKAADVTLDLIETDSSHDEPRINVTITGPTDNWDSPLYEYRHVIFNYCPFCGKKIDMIIDREEDDIDLYNRLLVQRDRYNKKFHRTDSIKKSDQYRSAVRWLDIRMAELQTLVPWDDKTETRQILSVLEEGKRIPDQVLAIH